MKKKKVLHVCNGCGKQEMLDPNKRHWHDCHPAKFSFIVKSDKILIGKFVGEIAGRK